MASSKNTRWCGLIFFTIFIVHLCESNDPFSVSQISPKSQHVQEIDGVPLEALSTSNTHFDNIILQSKTTEKSNNKILSSLIEDVDQPHIRVERSAMPILNELQSKSNLEFDRLRDFESNDVEASGRYFNYIKATKTLTGELENGEITTSQRMGKDLSNDPFLLKGGLRSVSSGSPINPTTVTQIFPAVATISHNNPRQNSNPDIQDIITGIVKLLNGNVNVHANTQVHRRPVASRINNRGPPRISEAQPLPNEYDHHSTMRPPPYPFDRPEGPIRPFLTGVPIPEQIVPSMQQNYRPGFVSQNRPPWQRPRPRPPLHGNRRPIPPYKPLPPLYDYHPENESQMTPNEPDANATVDLNPTGGDGGTVPDIKDDNKEDEMEYLSGPTAPTTEDETVADVTSEMPVKKDEHVKKKDGSKLKSPEKKPILPVTASSFASSTEMATVMKTTAILNTVQPSVFPYEDIESAPDLQSSLDEPQTVTEASSKETPSIILLPKTTTTQMGNLATSGISSTLAPTSSKPLEIQTDNFDNAPPNSSTTASPLTPSSPTPPYQPRPGIVLDDPEFKPGGSRPNQKPPPVRPQLQPTRPLPPGYGEIFDVTLSAIQGPGSNSGSQQTIKIKPFGSYGATGNGDIIVAPAEDEGFVSIDGKRTYINLFGDPVDGPTASTSSKTVHPIMSTTTPPSTTGIGHFAAETKSPLPPPTKPTKPTKPQTSNPQVPSQRPPYRHRTTQPPVRIDTCIVGDDSTCDQAQNEKCKTENGVSSCHCRPGYSRRKHREPCRRVVSFFMSLRVDKIYERRIIWDKLLLDRNSDPYGQLSYESVRAIDSAMSMTPYSDEFMGAKVNNIYRGDASQGSAGVFVNLTLKLEENLETLRPTLRNDVQKHLLGVIHRRNNNIGNSVLYVESPPGSISNLQDLDECRSAELNDCHPEAFCMNTWGSFRCECEKGLRDPWSDQPQRAGRDCHSCPESHCNNRGTCRYEGDGTQVCTCEGSYYGSQCEIDGEVLGVAIGASVAAVIIIVLTLVCLIMWSRRWHREQKNAMGSPVFGYMATAQVKTPGIGQPPYQVTLEDRMRWAQIADVMAQANHYAAEPVASTRPSSAIFGYPSLHSMNMGTMGGLSMAGTLPIHSGGIPPVPLPRRLGINSRSNGMRTLENSSSSEEEDRTDLLGRNFHVPRPKSRSNGSIANQSGIYYDVDYEPAGGDMYGTTTTSISNQMPGPQGIPMSTYTSGRAPSSYYMK